MFIDHPSKQPSILILSQSAFEPTTEDVIDWLEYFGARWIRINGEDIDGDSSLVITISGSQVNITFGDDYMVSFPGEVQALWFRRWQNNGRHEITDIFNPQYGMEGFKSGLKITKHLDYELKKLSHFLFMIFDGNPWLSRPESIAPSKLYVLLKAAEVGLEIPDSLVTNNKKTLKAFAEKHSRIITKAIGEALLFTWNEDAYAGYTEEIPPSLIDEMPSTFFPSFFQKQIEKEYEVRAFFLNKECHSMAIFSQEDPRTRTDFRKYNYDIPNRCVPYKLPPEISEKIASLMVSLNLDTGSIDMVVTPDQQHVFLELNPIGQFGMVSYPCNYFLEQKVAKTLILKANSEKT